MKNLNIEGLNEELECLSNEELGLVMKAIFEYAETNEVPETIKQIKTNKNEKNKIVLFVFNILKNKVLFSNRGAKKGNKNACKKLTISSDKKTNKNEKNKTKGIDLFVFDKKDENEKEKDIKEKDKEEKILESKKESKENNILKNNTAHVRESYDEIISVFDFSLPVKNKIRSFIQYCHLNRQILTNDQLDGILVELDLRYEGDDLKIRALDDAMRGGYFALRRANA